METTEKKYVLTVITVCYNSEKTIGRTIESIGPQLTDEIEYLIIDGKSTDGTLRIIEEARKKYQIKTVSETDKGIYDAMNKAAKLAGGNWLLYINSDDRLKENVLAQMLPILKANVQNDCICTDVEMHREVHGEWYCRIWEAEEVREKVYLYMPSCHQGMYIRKKSMQELGGFDCRFKIAADWDLFCRMYRKNMSFVILHIITAEFLEGGASNKRMVGEKHRIRVKNHAGKWILVGLLWDIKNRLRSELARVLLGEKKEEIAVRKKYIRQREKIHD